MDELELSESSQVNLYQWMRFPVGKFINDGCIIDLTNCLCGNSIILLKI